MLLRLFQAFREGLRRHLRTDLRRTGLSNLLRTCQGKKPCKIETYLK